MCKAAQNCRETGRPTPQPQGRQVLGQCPSSETHGHSSEAHSTQLPRVCPWTWAPASPGRSNHLRNASFLLVGAPIPLPSLSLSLSGITHQLSFLNPNPCLRSTSDGNRTEHHSHHQGAICCPWEPFLCSAELTRGPSPGVDQGPGGMACGRL